MPKRCRWSVHDDCILVETLLAQKAAGNQAQSGWKSTAWSAVAAELKKVAIDGEAEKTAAKCNDHYSNLKNEYVQVKRLRGISGFGWDDGRKLVVAADEHWDELKKRDPHIGKWKATPFPLYNDMHSLVDGVIATGSGAFQAGAQPTPEPPQSVASRESSIESTERTQSPGPTILGTPPQQGMTDEKENDLETKALHKKRKRSPNTPEPSQTRKHRRRQQQEQTQGLIAEMTRVVQALCSSLQPAPIPPQSPRKRRAAAIDLMERDGDFEKSGCIPVIRLFTSSIDVVDSYLAIKDKEVRKLYIEDSLSSRHSL